MENWDREKKEEKKTQQKPPQNQLGHIDVSQPCIPWEKSGEGYPKNYYGRILIIMIVDHLPKSFLMMYLFWCCLKQQSVTKPSGLAVKDAAIPSRTLQLCFFCTVPHH